MPIHDRPALLPDPFIEGCKELVNREEQRENLKVTPAERMENLIRKIANQERQPELDEVRPDSTVALLGWILRIGVQSPAKQRITMERTFRMRPFYRKLAIAVLIFSTAMAALSAVGMAIEAPAGRKMLAVIVFPLLWSPFIGLSLWLLIAHHKEQLRVCDDRLKQQGVLAAKEIDILAVTQLRWISGAGGVVQLRTAIESLRIELGNFEFDERLWLIRYFRERTPDGIQDGWADFCWMVALPIRDECDHPDRLPKDNEVRLHRSRWDWYFLPAIGVATLFGLAAAVIIEFPRLLVAPLPLILIWLVLRFATPKNGMILPRMAKQHEELGFLWFLLGWTVLGIGGIPVAVGLAPLLPVPWFWGLLAVLTWIGVLLYGAERVDRRRREKMRDRRPVALQEWAAGEQEFPANQ